MDNQEICQRAVEFVAGCIATVERVAPGEAETVDKWISVKFRILDTTRALTIERIDREHLTPIGYAMANSMRENRIVSLHEHAPVGDLQPGEKIVAEARAHGLVAFVVENEAGESMLNVQAKYVMLGPARQPGQPESSWRLLRQRLGFSDAGEGVV